MKHSEWLRNVTNGDSVNATATRAGVVQRTLARQLEKERIDAENVIAIAVAYDQHPVGALVDTGYLDEQWAQQVDPSRALREVTEEQLADEVLRRMRLGVEAGGALDTPVDELASRRTDGGTRSEVDSYGKPHLAVADRSAYNEEENTEFDD